MEKTLIADRSPEYNFGVTLWSPQKDKSGADIYSNMRAIKKDDVILHLIDNQIIAGVSLVNEECKKFICPPGEWGGRDGYLIQLKNFYDFRETGEELSRETILKEKNKEILLKILSEPRIGKLFFNKTLNLNQGAYITAVPEKLADLINKEFYLKNNRNIPYFESKSSLQEEEKMQEINTQEYSENFINFLERRGFSYDAKTVENFLLSLKVKPFLILSGNSGTGKTKLAQLFAEYVSNSQSHTLDTTVLIGKIAKNNGWSLNNEEFFNHFQPLPYDNVKYKIEVNGIEGEGKISINPRLFLTSESENIRKHLSEENEDARVPLKLYIDTNNFNQHSIIPVGANWTDNRHLFGFYNMITSKYQTAPALDLILHSLADRSKPYFLILDEMNLSHVERYFFDFLSCIESGERIQLHNATVDDVPRSVDIPDNLFIIGTINVDETTYMFSPKVLDRANTMEFESVDAENYLSLNKTTSQYSGSAEYLENPLLGSEIRNKKGFELLPIIFKNGNQELIDILVKMQNILEPYNLSFGFRVIDEIMRFMYVSWEYESRPINWNWKRYLDAQIKQKILPKIHGNNSIAKPLKELFSICAVNKDIDYINSNDLDSVDFPTSAKKILKMWNILKDQRYVSFVC